MNKQSTAPYTLPFQGGNLAKTFRLPSVWVLQKQNLAKPIIPVHFHLVWRKVSWVFKHNKPLKKAVNFKEIMQERNIPCISRGCSQSWVLGPLLNLYRVVYEVVTQSVWKVILILIQANQSGDTIGCIYWHFLQSMEKFFKKYRLAVTNRGKENVSWSNFKFQHTL